MGFLNAGSTFSLGRAMVYIVPTKSEQAIAVPGYMIVYYTHSYIYFMYF